MKLKLGIVTLALLTTLLPLTSARGFPGENGRLTYSDGGIVTSNPDGTDVVRLTDSSADVNSAWSAEGSKLVYVCDDQICTMNADGSNQTQITDDPSVDFGHPSWSPDGTLIVHRRATGLRTGLRRTGTLWVMNPTGQGEEQLTSFESSNPSWSPNGERIAFTRGNIGVEGVWSIRADGSGLKKLYDDIGYTSHPVWSPTGRRVAFLRLLHDHWRVWTVGRRGADAREIYKSGDDRFSGNGFTWSPDGRFFLLSDRDDSTLFRIDRDGSSKTTLSILGRHQDWAPATS